MVVCAAVAALVGCGVQVRHATVTTVGRVQAERVAATGCPLSDPTFRVLEQEGLLAGARLDPAGAFRSLEARLPAVPRPDQLVALAELADRAGRQADDLLPAPAAAWYRDAAACAAAALAAAPSDCVVANLATDLHNRAVERLLKLAQDPRVRRGRSWPDVLAELGVGLAGSAPYLEPRRFEELDPAREFAARGMQAWYTRGGLGVPLVAFRRNDRECPDTVEDRYFPGRYHAAATAVLHVDGPTPEPRRRATLVLHDPFEADALVLGGTPVRLAYDRTTPLAVQIAWTNLAALARRGLLRPEVPRPETGPVLYRPYQPGRIPVVFIHGLYSSPATWVQTINHFRSDPELSERFQFWFYLYPTGAPIPELAARLRRDLRGAIAAFDPGGHDPALGQMVLVGHSMGGLLAKLMAQDSGTEMWDTVFTRPPDALDVSPEARRALLDALVFAPEPYVRRLVFVSTPHRGSALASRLPGRAIERAIRPAGDFNEAVREAIVAHGRGVRGPGVQLRRFDGVGGMRPDDPVLETMARLPIDPAVPFHSIIPLLGIGELRLPTDGLVSLDSMRLDGAASEFILTDSHDSHDSPPVTAEVRRILREHLAAVDAAGPPP